MQDLMPEKKIVNLAGKEAMELTQTQINQHTQIGYAFAFVTLGFLFCGVCVAHSVIEEQNNKVFIKKGAATAMGGNLTLAFVGQGLHRALRLGAFVELVPRRAQLFSRRAGGGGKRHARRLLCAQGSGVAV